MSHYRTGTIATTNGSTYIAGSGTDFISGAAIGECVQAPDGKLYEIQSIQSAGALTLGQAYMGATASGQAYSIVPTQSYIRDLAGQAATLINSYAAVQTGAGAGKFGDGTQAVPGVRFAADEDTGMRRVGVNTLALVAAGQDRAVASTSGLLIPTVDINGGTIDGAVIGGAVPAAGAFTTLSASGAITTVGLSTLPGGIVELGRYIDFHSVNGAGDYDVRFDAGLAGNAVLTCASLALTGPLVTSASITNTSTDAASVSLSTIGLPATVGAYNLITSDRSTGSGNIQDNKWVMRGTGSGGWPSVKIHEGIGVDSSFLVPGSSTLSWTERLTNGGAGYFGWGSGPTTFMTLGNNLLSVTGLVAASDRITAGSTITANYNVDGAVIANYSAPTGYTSYSITEAGVTKAMFAYRGASASLGTRTNTLEINAIPASSITFRTADTERVRLDASGNLLVGVASGSSHKIQHPIQAQGNLNLEITNSARFYVGAGASGNVAATAVSVGGDSTTGRSINAGGTINAYGADYAEYERNNGLTFTKGSIVGFKADGTLTNVYADAVRFAVKSTNPSYVGGDTWGSEDQVGKRPDEPQRIADKTEQVLVSEAIPAVSGIEAVAEVLDDKGVVITKAVEAVEPIPAVEAVYETVVLESGDTDAQWATKQADYAEAKAAFEAALEAARQQVDRIAYSGKVPCNVMGATPGGYIIAAELDGQIAGEFAADPDFTQYKKAVGRVNRLLPDGRCEVAVIIH